MKIGIWSKGLFVITLVLSVSVVINASSSQNVQETQSKTFITTGQSLSRQNLQNLFDQFENRLQQNRLDHEASLLKAMLYFNTGSEQQALKEIDTLTQRAPDFHLAHLVRGDILFSRYGRVSDIGESPLMQEFGKEGIEKLHLLRAEAEARLKAMIEIELGNRVPGQLLGLGESIETAILVEKKYNRLFVYSRTAEHEPPRLIRDYYVSTGKKRGNKQIRGDLKTPEGVYFVTSWIPDEKLPAKYGVGAFPVNYPNELDRKLGKTGDGIWLHGTDPGYYSRPPLDSEGCVVLPNIDLSGLKNDIVPGKTPIIITEQADWLDRNDWHQQRKEIMYTLEKWRKDWESMDVNRYLSHYATDFWSGRHTLQTWAARKRYLARSKTYQRVRLSDIALFTYPARDQKQPVVVARFRQQYQSNNYNGDISKRVYLRKEGDDWRIMYEGG
ncbi:MAG: L,D-transpeptidase family protein [Gammaproteobacteria bacterium]|nr:L,D-transpeptidase family protein [Gammaproteobacteria bacterium]